MAARSHTQVQKHTLALVLCLIAIATPTCNGIPDQKPEAVEAWFKNLGNAKEKITKLRFYWYQPNCATLSSGSTSASKFGKSQISDAELRIGPELTSKLLGRSQEYIAFADQNEIALLKASNLVFTDGEFNGSTLTVLGRNPIKQLYREMPIIGGTGVFRLARGIATIKTYSFNSTNGHVVDEYNVVVTHY